MLALASITLCGFLALAEVSDRSIKSKAPARVRYSTPKEMNFEGEQIDGRMGRPDLSVVAGDAEVYDNGLLRLRNDFHDSFAKDTGEEIK
jgi:hypothetical protein